MTADAQGAARSGSAPITLAAMTLSASMILVDQTAVPLATADAIADLGGAVAEGQWILTANILPFAALMVLGGRLGDLLGLRRVFLTGAFIFMFATAAAGGAQDMPMMIAARAVQGVGAALMMPTAVAITSAVYPKERRGTALGILAGGSAFFAALGPVLGGLLTTIDWRLVFLINVPLAIVTIVLTLSATPPLRPEGDERPRIDYAGTAVFGLAIVALVFGLSHGPIGRLGLARDRAPAAGRRDAARGVRVDRVAGRGPAARVPALSARELPGGQHQPGAGGGHRARAGLPAAVLPAARDRREPRRGGHRAAPRLDPDHPRRPAGRTRLRP